MGLRLQVLLLWVSSLLVLLLRTPRGIFGRKLLLDSLLES